MPQIVHHWFKVSSLSVNELRWKRICHKVYIIISYGNTQVQSRILNQLYYNAKEIQVMLYLLT